MFYINGDLKTIDSTSFIPLTTHNDSGEKYSGVYTKLLLGEDVEVDQFLYFDITSKNWKKALATDYSKMPARALSMEAGSAGEKIKALLKGYSCLEIENNPFNTKLYIPQDNTTNEEFNPFSEDDFSDNYIHQNVGNVLDGFVIDTTTFMAKDYQFIPQLFENVYVSTQKRYYDFYEYGSYQNPINLTLGIETVRLPVDIENGVCWFKFNDTSKFEGIINTEIDSNNGIWLLAATIARDGVNTWTYNNRSYFYNGADLGTINNALTKDYQNKNIWTKFKANQFMITVNNNPSKYIMYNGFLSSKSLSDRWPSTLTTDSAISPNTIVGSWWFDSSGNRFYAVSKDTDTRTSDGGLLSCGYGYFVFNSRYGDRSNYCCAFQLMGAIARQCAPTVENWNAGSYWGGYGWWAQNIPSGSALNIYVR